MTIPDKADSSPLELSLEPLEGEALKITATDMPKFRPDGRSGKERRQTADRRTEIRFQDDRRSGKDRRAKRSWEPGNNL
jgi:hypothetical protein